MNVAIFWKSSHVFASYITPYEHFPSSGDCTRLFRLSNCKRKYKAFYCHNIYFVLNIDRKRVSRIGRDAI